MTKKTARAFSKLKVLNQVSEFPLLTAMNGRRSRRFAQGSEIKSGPLAFKSSHPVYPLDEFERTMIISAMAGVTGWSHLIPSNQKYAPKLPNYAGTAGARTFPSGAGFHCTDLFFTDDSGTYFVSTKDLPPTEHNQMASDFSIDEWMGQVRGATKKIDDHRLQIPNEEPFMESHNLWVSNSPGSLFAIPVSDLAQHCILALCYLLQNGYIIFDDINKRKIPGMEKFAGIADVENAYPLTYFDQMCLGEATVELSTSCYSAALLLQAMGLGGWMYDGVDRHAVFGVTGDPRNKGLGFHSHKREDWNFPNPTGLKGIFETKCPPFFGNMKEAVKSVVERKFGAGGPFNESTPGPWLNSKSIRSAAAPHLEDFIDCVSTQAQYVFDTFGKFPATIPSAYCLMYLQAFHLDTEFYDKFYGPGSYLPTHAHHHDDWHS